MDVAGLLFCEMHTWRQSRADRPPTVLGKWEQSFSQPRWVEEAHFDDRETLALVERNSESRWPP